MKRRANSLVRDVGSLTVSGLAVGAGSQALHTAFGTDYGVSGVGSYMPIMGNVVGAKAVIGMTSGMMPKKKRHR